MRYLLSYKHKYMEYYSGDSVVYDIKDTDYKTKLFYSDSDDNWTDRVKGTKGASLNRKNDDVIIKISGKKLVVDYSELEMLYLLLVHNNNTETFKTIISEIKDVD